jgi:3-oxoacyl-[acyl-carrier protein] reductase
MANYSELNGRVALITGAAQGIGAETARLFAQQGSKVAIVDIDADNGNKVASGIAKGGGTAQAFKCDITDVASVEQCISGIVQAFGGIDIVINCAGGYKQLATVEDMSIDEWDRTVALNLRSVFLICKMAIPHLKKSRAGRIINVSSISGRTVHAASSPAYGAAKAGVTQLTRFLAYQLGPDNITANAIAPITTLTPRVAALRSEADIERIAAQVPLRRLAVPEDHAQAMLFLASDAAAYINGVVLDVNGGRVMM